MGRSKTQRLIIGVNAAISVTRRPTGGVLKQANGANAPISAEVKPMTIAGRHSDQVSSFDLDRDNGASLRPQVKQSATFDDEPHLVIVVSMLSVEFRQHLGEPVCHG